MLLDEARSVLALAGHNVPPAAAPCVPMPALLDDKLELFWRWAAPVAFTPDTLHVVSYADACMLSSSVRLVRTRTRDALGQVGVRCRRTYRRR